MKGSFLSRKGYFLSTKGYIYPFNERLGQGYKVTAQGYEVAAQGYKTAVKSGFREVSDTALFTGGSTRIVATGPMKLPKIHRVVLHLVALPV